MNGSKHVAYTNNDGAELIINTGGGLKADGYPLGATGIRQVLEIVTQLRGEGCGRQVDKDELKTGLAHNLGGTGGLCGVHILTSDLQ